MPSFHRRIRMTPFICALALVAIVSPLLNVALAQTAIKSYDTKPSLSYTFDVNPNSFIHPSVGVVQGQGSTFEYSLGAGSHTGVLSLDGSHDYVDLSRFYDDDGKNFSAGAYGGEMSFEVWASWTALDNWSRLFDLGSLPAGRTDALLIANQGSTGTITWDQSSGSTSSGYLSYSGGVSLYNWQHVAVTVTANPSGTTANTAAMHTMYLNGVQVANKTGFMPAVMARPLAWLGRSNWESAGDQRFRGLFDDVLIFNYSLSAEAIAAHYLVPRVARFDHTFDKSPSSFMIGGSLAYGWEAFDASDSTADQRAHRGLLVLSSTSSQYLNLASPDGPNAIATTLSTLGGAGWVVADEDTVGWSFEITVKFTTLTANACLFDISNNGANRIALCFSQTASTLIFTVSDANANGGATIAMDVTSSTTPVAVNTWYHIVLNVQPSTSSTTGRYESFINSRFTNSINSGVWPTSVDRPHAFVGRSFAGVYLNARIDSLRIYDYSLTAAEVRSLFGAVTGTNIATTTPLYSTAPSISHTFDVSVPWSVRNGGTKLGWLQNVGTRVGILSLLASDTQYVNLLTLPDRNLKLFPGYIGGRSVSFEFWVIWNVFNGWARLIDLSGETNSGTNQYYHNILISTLSTADTTLPATLVFLLDGGANGWVESRLDLPNAVYLNRWYHVVCTAKLDRTQNINSTSSTQLQIYLDGELRAFRPSTGPASTNRPYNWIGRSRYSADGWFGGYIDAFHYYDYALEAEQVRAHFAVPRPPLFELTFSSEPTQMPLMPMTASSLNYLWVANDTTSSIQGRMNHPGLLVLSATAQQYLDLTTVSGAATIGTVMPQLAVLPDLNSLTTTFEFPASSARARVGMTLEMSFKYSQQLSGASAKLFSCSGSAGDNSIVDLIEVGFFAGSRDLTLFVSNSDTGNSSTTLLVASVSSTQWYHVTAVIRLASGRLSTSMVDVFVDGMFARTVSGAFPYATLRDKCVLGRGVQGETNTYFDGKIDLFRVYDYALNGSEVATIVAQISPYVDPDSRVDVSSSGVGGGGMSSSLGSISSSLGGAASISSSVGGSSSGSSRSSSGVAGGAASSSGTTNVECVVSNSSSSSSSLSDGAIAGIVIACVVGALVLAALAVVYVRSTATSSFSGGKTNSPSASAASAHVEMGEVRQREQESV